MNTRIAFLMIVICSVASIVGARGNAPLQITSPELEILDARIGRLESERDQKMTALQKCERDTKGFKIAGISTIAATGIGLYANIKLHEKLASMTGGAKTDNRPSSEKCSEEQEDCKDTPNDPFCKAILGKGCA